MNDGGPIVALLTGVFWVSVVIPVTTIAMSIYLLANDCHWTMKACAMATPIYLVVGIGWRYLRVKLAR